MSNFKRTSFTTAAGNDIEVTLFDDGTAASRIDGNIEWAGDVETVGAVAHGASQILRLYGKRVQDD